MAMTITVMMEALTGSFETDTKRAAKTAQKAVADIGDSFKGLALKAAAAFGAYEVIDKFTDSILESINAMDELSKAAQKTGLTTEQLSGLKYAASLADVEFDQLTSGLEKFNKATIDATNGSAQQIAAFKGVGISVKDLKTLNPEQLLLKISDAFAGSKDNAAKTTIAIALFGKAGADLIPLLNEGSSGFNELIDQAKKFGLIVGTDAAHAAEDFNDNLTRLHAAMSGVAISAAQDLTPEMVKLEQILLDPKVIDGLGSLITGFAKFAEVTIEAAAALGNFFSKTKDADAQNRYIGSLKAIDELQSRIAVSKKLGLTSQVEALNAELESTQKLVKILEPQNLDISAKKLAQAGGIFPSLNGGISAFLPKQNQPISLLRQPEFTPGNGRPATGKDLQALQLPVDRSAVFSAQLKANLALSAESLKQQQALYESSYNDGVISTADYYAKRLATIKAGEADAVKEIQQSIAQIKKEQAAQELTPQQQVALQAKLVGLYGQMSLAESKAADEAKNLAQAQADQADKQIRALKDISIAANDASVRGGIQRQADNLEDAHSKGTISYSKYYDGLKNLEDQRYKESVDLANKQLENFKGTKDQELVAAAENNAKLEDLAQQHANNINKINKQSELSKQQILQGGLAAAGGIFSALGDLQNKSTKDGFERWKKFAIAQAVVSTIQGAVGAFSQTAASYPAPYGEIAGGIAAAAVIAAGLAQVQQIRAQQFSPGRAIGGPVGAGGMYQVGENNQPELLRYGNKTLLMMGDQGGSVVPARAGQAANDASGNLHVNVSVIGTNGPTSATAKQDDNQLMLQLAINGAQLALQKDLTRGGPTSKVLQQTFSLQRQGR